MSAHKVHMPKLPQPYKKSITSATFKSEVEDFVVNEMLSIDFTEEGEHLWLQITKININTVFLANSLAKWAKIPARDVGYSGLKDRKGITTQWFSLRIPKKIMPSKPLSSIELQDDESIAVLATHWHNKKLNRGTHKHNQFIVTLKHVDADRNAVHEQLQKIKDFGLPNYFGEQRFGKEGNNVEKFLAYTANMRKSTAHDGTTSANSDKRTDHKKRRRKQPSKLDKERSILISSARSAIFNAILAQRVMDNTWNRAIAGEVCNLTGSSSIFTLDAEQHNDENIIRRMREMDIHPTAILWGIQKTTAAAESEREREREHRIAQDISTAELQEQQLINSDVTLSQIAADLEVLGIKASRRSLRLQVHNLSWQWLASTTDNKIDDRIDNNSVNHGDNEVLQLTFELPTGSYATNVIDCLVVNTL